MSLIRRIKDIKRSKSEENELYKASKGQKEAEYEW